MKKILLSICALAAVMTSCTKSSVVDAPKADTPIQFTSYSGRTPESKATSVEDAATLATAGGFQVIAFRHEAGVTPTYTETPYMKSVVNGVSTTTGEGESATTTITWTPENKAYWLPSNDPDVLDFVAYSLNTKYGENNANNAVSLVTTDYSEVTYTVPTEVADQKDFLVATPQKNLTLGADSGDGKRVKSGGTVELKFNHVLSRIGFSLCTNQKVEISTVTLTGKFATTSEISLVAETPAFTTTTGTENVTYSLWPNGGKFTSSENPDIDTKQPIYNDGTEKGNRYMMIIPYTGESVTAAEVDIKYTLNEQPFSTTVTLVDNSSNAIKFEAGKSYDIKMTIKAEEIAFSVKITPWETPSTNEEVEVPITLS